MKSNIARENRKEDSGRYTDDERKLSPLGILVPKFSAIVWPMSARVFLIPNGLAAVRAGE